MQHDGRNQPQVATEAARWKELYRQMRNIAAGYSNLMADDANSKTLDRQFNECEIRAEIIGTEHDYASR